MSQPHRSQRLAGRRVKPVPIPLDSDSDSTMSIGIRCEVCGSEDPGVVHVPCCNFAAHRQCLTHDAEVSCPYCGMDLQPMFDLLSSQGSNSPSCGRDLGNCVVYTGRIGRLPSLNHRTTAGWSGLHLLWPTLKNGQLGGYALVVRERWTSRMLHAQIHRHVPSV